MLLSVNLIQWLYALAQVLLSVQGLLGGLSNVVECLRGEGAPPPAVRAVVHAALHYVDAELLNALVLRRDCCSISAIKALQVRITRLHCSDAVNVMHVVPFQAVSTLNIFCSPLAAHCSRSVIPKSCLKLLTELRDGNGTHLSL